MKSFESRVLEKISIEKAFDKATGTLKEERINPETFKDRYGPEQVDEDLKYVEEKEKLFRETSSPETREKEMMAEVLETIVHKHAELSDWLGPNAFTIKPSRFDDIKHGVDSIVEFRKEEKEASHLALAIDVTSSPELEKKLSRIKREIEKGELTRIKYFASEFSGKSELTKIPRVVIGADKKTIEELSDLWMEGKNKELGRHKIQFQILEEIRMQLVAFKKYAQEKNQDEIAVIYDRALKIIKGIIEEKGEKTTTEDFDKDKVFSAMKGYLYDF